MSEAPLALALLHDASRPLAIRLRPRVLADVVGQDHLPDEQAVTDRVVAQHRSAAMILSGAARSRKDHESLSATFSCVADLRRRQRQAPTGRAETLLFVDYHPSDTGYERSVQQRLQWWERQRARRQHDGTPSASEQELGHE